MEIPLGTLGIGSGWALVTLFVVMFFRGDVVARKTHEDQVHQTNEWRAESRIKDAQLAEKDTQIQLYAEVGRTVTAIMEAIHELARQQNGHHSSEVDRK